MAKGSTSFVWIGAAIALLFVITNSQSANAANSVSSDQLQQIADRESFSPAAYPDGSNGIIQNYSIGYGHQIQPSEQYLLTATITPEQGMALLQADVQKIVNAILASGVTFTQGQFDALTDFGMSGLSALNNVIQTYVNSGDAAAQAKILQYVYWHPDPSGPAVLNQNLVARRNSEIVTWNN